MFESNLWVSWLVESVKSFSYSQVLMNRCSRPAETFSKSKSSPFSRRGSHNDSSSSFSSSSSSSSLHTVKLDFYITRLAPAARFFSCYEAPAHKRSSIICVKKSVSRSETELLFSSRLFLLSCRLRLQRGRSTGFLLWWMTRARRWPRLMWSEPWISG